MISGRTTVLASSAPSYVSKNVFSSSFLYARLLRERLADDDLLEALLSKP